MQRPIITDKKGTTLGALVHIISCASSPATPPPYFLTFSGVNNSFAVATAPSSVNGLQLRRSHK